MRVRRRHNSGGRRFFPESWSSAQITLSLMPVNQRDYDTMEQLLHYVWRHRIYPLRPLQTTDGQPLEVIDPGLPNTHAGPDFFNAKVKLGDTLWAGDVEVHDRASDWLRHGHDRDRAYDRVVLHAPRARPRPGLRPGGAARGGRGRLRRLPHQRRAHPAVVVALSRRGAATVWRVAPVGHLPALPRCAGLPAQAEGAYLALLLAGGAAGQKGRGRP